MYTHLIEHGSSKKTIEDVFNNSFEKIKKNFDDIVDQYNSLSNVIGELKTYKFIIEKNDHDKSIFESIKKKITYPIFLLIVLLILLIVFNIKIIPSLKTILEAINSTSPHFWLFRIFICFLVILYFVFIFVVLIFVNKYKNDTYSFYTKLYKRNDQSFLVDYLSIEYAKYFLILYELGLSTKDCFSLLSKLKNKDPLATISENANFMFEQGYDIQFVIENLAYDNKLKRFIIIGIEAGILKEMLTKYIDIKTVYFFNKLDRNLKIIEILIYFIVSIFIVMLYSLLLLPIQNIQL
ncbi:MAG: hypothetical protein PHG99_03475 [Erysipelotrichaceae bacterium]|nr:hypothetical protein [Erysipelotrichaceae bacterium]